MSTRLLIASWWGWGTVNVKCSNMLDRPPQHKWKAKSAVLGVLVLILKRHPKPCYFYFKRAIHKVDVVSHTAQFSPLGIQFLFFML